MNNVGRGVSEEKADSSQGVDKEEIQF